MLKQFPFVIFTSLFLFLALIMVGCDEGDTEDQDSLVGSGINKSKSTWSLIQENILQSNCVNCHVAGSSVAQQTGLILTADKAYKELVDKPPNIKDMCP